MLERSSLLRCAATAVAGVALGSCVLLLLRSSDAPRIRVSSREIDFGRVSPGGLAHERVTISNAGEQPLRIENIKLSCGGCSHATLNKPLIPPGEDAELLLAVRGTPARRETLAEAALISNDPKTPVLVLTLRFSTLDDIWAEPTSVDMGSVAREALPQSRSFRIHFARDSNADPRLLRCSMTSQHFKPVMTPTDDPRTVEINVELLASAPSGQHRSSVALRADDDSTSISVEVHAFVRGALFAIPPAVVLGPLTQGMEGQTLQTIAVRRRDGRHARLRVELSPALARILDVDVSAADALEMRLRPATSIQQEVSGAVLVQATAQGFEDVEDEFLTIPVTLLWVTERLRSP